MKHFNGLKRMSTIGVLDLQGGVLEHLDHLYRLGIYGRRVREAKDFDGLDGLIIPGGESTCLSNLLKIFELDELIVQGFRNGLKLWGTCAGAILLAKSIIGEPAHLGLIDIEIHRNAFGSQLDSFQCEAYAPGISPYPIPLTFIRAPKIVRIGEGVKVLLRQEDYIVAAESPGVLVTVFHPELTSCLAFHRYFAKKCGIDLYTYDSVNETDPAWCRMSWMRHAKVV